jgi:hypothetical protein
MLHTSIDQLLADVTARVRVGDVRQQDVIDLLEALALLLDREGKLRARLEETDGQVDAFGLADLQGQLGGLEASVEEKGGQIAALEEDRQRDLSTICGLVRLLAAASRGEPVPRRTVADVLASGGWKRSDLARLWTAVRWQRVEDGGEKKH